MNGGNENDMYRNMISTTLGGFLYTGYTYSETIGSVTNHGSGTSDIFLIKYNELGEIE